MSYRRAFGVVAGVVVVIGVVLALMPLSVDGGSIGCGSAFSPSEVEAVLEDAFSGPFSDMAGECEDAVSQRRVVAYGLAGVGGLVLLFLFLTGDHKTRWDAPEQASGGGSA